MYYGFMSRFLFWLSQEDPILNTCSYPWVIIKHILWQYMASLCHNGLTHRYLTVWLTFCRRIFCILLEKYFLLRFKLCNVCSLWINWKCVNGRKASHCLKQLPTDEYKSTNLSKMKSLWTWYLRIVCYFISSWIFISCRLLVLKHMLSHFLW